MQKSITQFGYKPKGYGHVRLSNTITHWITFFENNQIQMYAYLTDDDTFEKVYDTGVISVTPQQLLSLMLVFSKSHN